MKEIRAYVQPFLLDRITEALLLLEEFPGMSVSEVRGFGRGRKLSMDLAHRDDVQDFTQKVRLDILVGDERVQAVVETLLTAAHTGNRGDGKIFVLPVEEAIRIRTGEHGDAAVWSEVGDEEGPEGGRPKA